MAPHENVRKLKIMQHRYVLAAIVICVQTSVATGNELDRMICSHAPFTSCVGATVESCLEARQGSETICDERFPVTQMAEGEDKYEYAKAVGLCSLNESARLLNLTRSEFDHCVRHLEPIFEDFYNRQRKRREKW